MRAYIASGWFTPEQESDLNIIKRACASEGIEYYSPRDENLVDPKGDKNWRQKAFETNLSEIADSNLVIANTRDKDMGTIFEAGFAYGQGKPIIYFLYGASPKNFNLMLAESGVTVITSYTGLQDTLRIMKNVYNKSNDYPTLKEYLAAIHPGSTAWIGEIE